MLHSCINNYTATYMKHNFNSNISFIMQQVFLFTRNMNIK